MFNFIKNLFSKKKQVKNDPYFKSMFPEPTIREKFVISIKENEREEQQKDMTVTRIIDDSDQEIDLEKCIHQCGAKT